MVPDARVPAPPPPRSAIAVTGEVEQSEHGHKKTLGLAIVWELQEPRKCFVGLPKIFIAVYRGLLLDPQRCTTYWAREETTMSSCGESKIVLNLIFVRKMRQNVTATEGTFSEGIRPPQCRVVQRTGVQCKNKAFFRFSSKVQMFQLVIVRSPFWAKHHVAVQNMARWMKCLLPPPP